MIDGRLDGSGDRDHDLLCRGADRQFTVSVAYSRPGVSSRAFSVGALTCGPDGVDRGSVGLMDE